MANEYRAAVFNQDEADFMRAAEAIERNIPISIQDLHLLLRTHAIGLNNYIAHYMEDIVEPINTNEDTGEICEVDRRNLPAFRGGVLTTFKMVSMVAEETDTPLPSLKGNLSRMPAQKVSGECNINAPIINHFYRGAELRDKFPHLYGPVLRLMQAVSDRPVETLRADLNTPLYSHRNVDEAFLEFHFLGGAAEVVLTIEDQAAREAGR